MIDWAIAAEIGGRLAPRGPDIAPSLAHHAVAEIRELAQLARVPVAELTGLSADDSHAPAVVVDRTEWINANISGFSGALDPFLTARAGRVVNPVARAVGSRISAVQIGGALAWLSGKVLGQYEAFSAPNRPGRLLLVAPNIVQVEADLELVPRDFRFWVCLHEETHRVQFGGVPWLRTYFLSEVHALIEASNTGLGGLVSQAGSVADAVVSALRGSPGPSLLEAAQSPDQRAIFDRLTGLMSLLEGHADFVMDEVGQGYVPTVAIIRQRFAARRSHAGTVDGFARRLLGLETKLQQYTSGAEFVRSVIEKAGPDGFAQVWQGPANVPTAPEIADPSAWVARVLS